VKDVVLFDNAAEQIGVRAGGVDCDILTAMGFAARGDKRLRAISRMPAVGNGERPVTSKIQEAFFGIFNGDTEDEWGWLDPVG